MHLNAQPRSALPLTGRARGGVVLVLALLAGCAVTERGPTTAPPAAPEAARAPAAGDAAVEVLVARADDQMLGGRPELSAATLERALRISPRDPRLWQRLAQVRLDMGHAERAEGLASRSNSLAEGDRALQRENWRLIAAARRLRGDEPGAREAEERVRALQ